MNLMIRSVLPACFLFTVPSAPLVFSAESVPAMLHYQGTVSVDDVPFTGNGQFKFALICPDGATSFWSNDGTSVAGSQPVAAVTREVNGGIYSVGLGDTSLANMAAIPLTAFASQPNLHLRVWFNDGVKGFQQLQPDKPIGSVGYAMMAERAAGLTSNAEVAAANIPSGTLGINHLATPGAPLAGQVLSYNGNGFAWNDPVLVGGGDSVFSVNGANTYYNTGRVGIGTSSPAGALHVASGGLVVTGDNSPYTGVGKGVFIESNATFGGHVFAYDYGANVPRSLLLNYPGGNVGIGTATPSNKLEVAATWDQNFGANINLSGNRPTLMWSRSTGGFNLGDGPPGTSSWIAHFEEANDLLTFYRRRTTLGLQGTDTGWLHVAHFHPTGLAVTGDISYTGTLSKLDTVDLFDSTVRSAHFWFGNSARRGSPGLAMVDWKDAAGLKALVLNWDNAWQETHIGGAVTQVTTLRIIGGADLAEPFAMSHRDVSPGSVVVIDEHNPGKLRLSTSAYDKKVAGIVSGANGIQPGISMIQEDALEAGEHVALSGRVYVNANSIGGLIMPGDFLTTSDIPGEAMKAADHHRAQGAILGKAMTRLEDESGTVLVLVTLQ